MVNISTRQRVPVRTQADPLEEFFRRFGTPNPQQQGEGGQAPRTRETGSLGSGFIISPDGYVVTNNHLIAGQTGTGTVDTVTVTRGVLQDEAASLLRAFFAARRAGPAQQP